MDTAAPTLDIPFAVKLTGETYVQMQAVLGMSHAALVKQSININLDYSAAIANGHHQLATYWLNELHFVRNVLESVQTAQNILSRAETISPEAK